MNDSTSPGHGLITLSLLLVLTHPPIWGEALGPQEPPITELQASMTRWAEIYRRQMNPVTKQWGIVVLAIHEGRISDLHTLCPGFKSAVGALDRSSLLAAADPVVRANVRSAMDLLDLAAGKCHRRRFFDLSFQLYKARYLIEVIDLRLRLYSQQGVQ